MDKIKTFIDKVAVVLKYFALITAFFKAFEVFHDEIKKIDFDDKKEPEKIDENGN